MLRSVSVCRKMTLNSLSLSLTPGPSPDEAEIQPANSRK